MAESPADDILDESIAKYMRAEVCRIRPDQTVVQALAEVRRQQTPGRIIYFYVIDAEDRLVGVVPTRRLLLAEPDVNISDLMIRQVVTIPFSAKVREACQLFLQHKFLAFPVVQQGRVVGTVDVELFAEGIEDLEQTKQQDALFQLIGVHLDEAQQQSAWGAFRSRFPWLLCNIGGGILAAVISNLFDEQLQKVVAIALFIPVVLALSESVAIQSVSIALAVLNRQPCNLKALGARLSRELLTGLLLGLLCGTILAVVQYVWLGNAWLAVCLLTGIGVGVTGSAIFGMSMPFLLRLLKRDPQVAAGPIALTVADMLTLVVYFNLAAWLL